MYLLAGVSLCLSNLTAECLLVTKGHLTYSLRMKHGSVVGWVGVYPKTVTDLTYVLGVSLYRQMMMMMMMMMMINPIFYEFIISGCSLGSTETVYSHKEQHIQSLLSWHTMPSGN